MSVSNIYNMDCMEYMKTVPDRYFDLAVVDPPYGINAPSMNMGSNMTRTKGGYPSDSTASRLRKGRLDFWGCEIDGEYFRASDERFRRECLGIEKINDKIEIIQQSLF